MESACMQYLEVVDRMSEILRDLQVDYAELLLYDQVINGTVDRVPQGLQSTSVFFRACENLNTHLLEMKRICADMQALHWEML